jgi:hypothetical protein
MMPLKITSRSDERNSQMVRFGTFASMQKAQNAAPAEESDRRVRRIAGVIRDVAKTRNLR